MTGETRPTSVESPDVSEAATERDLVNRARTGDREALGGLYDLYLTRVYRYVLAHVGQPAETEDITAEIFLRLVENIARFEWQGVPFSAWLFRIARNQVITHYRKKGNRTPNMSMDDFDVEDSQPGPEWLVEQRVTTQEVFAACEKLPPSQRQVIALRFGAGLSVRETADTLGKTENNVKVLQHKAITKLQRMLGS